MEEERPFRWAGGRRFPKLRFECAPVVTSSRAHASLAPASCHSPTLRSVNPFQARPGAGGGTADDIYKRERSAKDGAAQRECQAISIAPKLFFIPARGNLRSWLPALAYPLRPLRPKSPPSSIDLDAERPLCARSCPWRARNPTSALSPKPDSTRQSRHVRNVPLPDNQEPGARGTRRAASSGGSSLRWRDERRRVHVPLFAEARSIASKSVSLKRQPSASRLALA
jgi:hypothetical protein